MAKNKYFINSAKAFIGQLNQVTEALYASVALAMWDRGFDQDEIEEIIQISQAIWDSYELNTSSMIDACEAETGLCIKTKKE